MSDLKTPENKNRGPEADILADVAESKSYVDEVMGNNTSAKKQQTVGLVAAEGGQTDGTGPVSGKLVFDGVEVEAESGETETDMEMSMLKEANEDGVNRGALVQNKMDQVVIYPPVSTPICIHMTSTSTVTTVANPDAVTTTTSTASSPVVSAVVKSTSGSAEIPIRSTNTCSRRLSSSSHVVSGEGKKRKVSDGSDEAGSENKHDEMSMTELLKSLSSLISESESRQSKKMQDLLKQSETTQSGKITKTIEAKYRLLGEEKKVENQRMLTEIKKEQQAIRKEIKDRNDEGKKALAKMEKTLKDLEKSTKDSIAGVVKSVADSEQRVSEVKADLSTLRSDVTEYQRASKEARKALHDRVTGMEEKVSGDVELDRDDFPIKKTIVARFVRQPDGMSAQELGEKVIHEFLEMPDVPVVKVKVMSRDSDGYGTVKILLDSAETLEKILQKKPMLMENDDYDVNCIKIRQSKTREQLVFEQNCDVIMKELHVYGNFYRLDQGWLVPRRGDRDGNRDSRGWRGRGRGRGRGTRRRGGRSGRQNSQRSRYDEYVNSNNSDYNRGRYNGYDPQDKRVAQQYERERNGMGGTDRSFNRAQSSEAVNRD